MQACLANRRSQMPLPGFRTLLSIVVLALLTLETANGQCTCSTCTTNCEAGKYLNNGICDVCPQGK
ncbi:hypothetical protein DPMN_185117 [Dreissena polymorpha]|uniref:Uncharacterized protein n=1 Tax=Dreissena polymorpha TaxID=45954 RepID=A0A9D4DLK6_DREPO|nr:hypothetical protein DPMN_185117 [Dreissena polymorpha]